MDPAHQHLPQDPESIQNIDTLRMTLRWAMERLRLLEKQKGDYSGGRDAYYKRLENLLSEYCRGTIDLENLISREVEIDRREKELDVRRIDFDREIAARKEGLTRRFKKLQAELEIGAQRQSDSMTGHLTERRKQLDKAYITRELAVRSSDHQLDVRETALKDLEARMDRLYREQKALHEKQYKFLQEEIQEAAEKRIQEWEKLRSTNQAARDRQWQEEKTELTAQAERWERQAREYLAKMKQLDAERIDAHSEIQNQIAIIEADFRAKEEKSKKLYEDRKVELDAREEHLRKLHADQLSDLKEQLKVIETQSRDHEEALSREKWRSGDLEKRLDEAQHENRGLAASLAQAAEKVLHWRENADTARKKREELEERQIIELSKLEERITDAHQKLREAETSQKESLRRQAAHIDGEYKKRHDAMAEQFETRRQAIETQAKLARAEYDATLAAAHQRLEDVQRGVVGLKDAVHREHESGAQWRHLAEDLRKEVESLKAEHQRLSASKDRKSADKLQGLLQDLREQERGLEESLLKEQSRNREMAERVQAAQDRLTNLEGTLGESQRAQLQRLQDEHIHEVEKLRERLEAALHAADEWRKAAEGAQTEHVGHLDVLLKQWLDQEKAHEVLSAFKSQLAEIHHEPVAQGEPGTEPKKKKKKGKGKGRGKGPFQAEPHAKESKAHPPHEQINRRFTEQTRRESSHPPKDS